MNINFFSVNLTYNLPKKYILVYFKDNLKINTNYIRYFENIVYSIFLKSNYQYILKIFQKYFENKTKIF